MYLHYLLRVKLNSVTDELHQYFSETNEHSLLEKISDYHDFAKNFSLRIHKKLA